MLPELQPSAWAVLVFSAWIVGLSKGGAPGVGIVPVLLCAWVFPSLMSTGILLVQLIVADFAAATILRRHASWPQLKHLLPIAVVGVVFGWVLMGQLNDEVFRKLLGGIILILVGLRLLQGKQVVQEKNTRLAWAAGIGGGMTTMLANAAGPVMSLYFLALGMSKERFVGTAAWFFLVINLVKVPFSLSLGLMPGFSWGLAAVLTPIIVLGVFSGRWLLDALTQNQFEFLALAFALLGGMRLLLW
ncbi:MAG: sulfite exporter TauE/SafE family protein [Verrucomicrobiales bacterium]